MAILAQAKKENGFIIPTPIDSIPEKLQRENSIIVAVFDYPCDTEKLDEVYSFYGRENCSRMTGKIVANGEKKTVICVSGSLILNKAIDPNQTPPPQHLSPLWTKDKFGMSPIEAQMSESTSPKVLSEVYKKINQYKKHLNDFQIKTNKTSLETIYNCQKIINEAQEQLEKTKLDCKWFCAESVAKFLRDKFDVNAWASFMEEPAVFFCIKEEKTDDEAVIIGNAIETLFNEIEPDESIRFFDEFVCEASAFPMVADVSFVENKRIKNKEDYQSISGGRS